LDLDLGVIVVLGFVIVVLSLGGVVLIRGFGCSLGVGFGVSGTAICVVTQTPLTFVAPGEH